jgi:serine/threonine protein kinase
LEGASHLTSKNILHRDIKPSNIIITHNSTAIIIDFGYC